MSVFITSDPHFGHRNLAINHRKFESVEDNDFTIITNWNKVVTKRDKVFILGDISMENHKVYPILEKLNGSITVVGGNHDLEKDTPYLLKYVERIVGCIDYKGFILTHIPIHKSELIGRYIGNLHGHLHKERIMINGEPDPLYYNVCMDLNNYTPIDFEYIKSIFAKNVIK